MSPASINLVGLTIHKDAAHIKYTVVQRRNCFVVNGRRYEPERSMSRNFELMCDASIEREYYRNLVVPNNVLLQKSTNPELGN